MTKYVEVKYEFKPLKKKVDCYTCKHGSMVNEHRKFPFCYRFNQTECMKNNYPHYEYRGKWYEKVVRIYEEDD